MKSLQPPPLERRRASDFERELLERARTWAPSWGADDEGDFGRALLAIAARFSSEVAERLDGSGDKMRRGFFDWLGVQRDAARAARMPVVFKMNAQASPVLAGEPVRMQAGVQGASVVFETESDIRLLPGRLETVVATDADADALFVQPPGLTEIEPQAAAPELWQLKSFAGPGSQKLQLDPAAGLAPEMIVEIASVEYRITEVKKDLVTIDPPLPTDAGFGPGTVVRKVSVFEPFAAGALNRQFHAIYLGHPDLLNIEAAATIDVVGAQTLAEANWHYWGKKDGEEEVGWKKLEAIPSNDGVALTKGHGAVETRDIDSAKGARWIRASTRKVDSPAPQLSVENLSLRVNCAKLPPCSTVTAATGLKTEALANTTPLVTSSAFYPLGLTPRQFDTFYLASDEAFSKKGADVQLCFTLAEPSFRSLSLLRGLTDSVVAGIGQDGALYLYKIDTKNGTITKFFEREPLQPPNPNAKGAPIISAPIPLDPKPSWRLPTWSNVGDVMVAVAAGSSIWVWSEIKGNPNQSGWISFGELPAATAGPPLVDGLVHLNGAVPLLVALRNQKLCMRALEENAPWSIVPTRDTSGPVNLDAIVPVFVVTAGQLETSAHEGLIGIAQGKLYAVSTDGITLAADGKSLVFPTTTPHAGDCDLLSSTPAVVASVRPVALRKGNTLTVVAASSNALRLVKAVTVGGTNVITKDTKDLVDTTDRVVEGSLEAALDKGELMAIATVRQNGLAYLATWTPALTGANASLFVANFASGGAPPTGSPTIVGQYAIVPGDAADVLVAPFDLALRLSRNADIGTGIVMPSLTPAFAPNDVVTFEVKGKLEVHQITRHKLTLGSEDFYALDSTPLTDVGGEVLAYRTSSAGFSGTWDGAKKEFTLEKDERGAVEESPIVIEAAGTREVFLVKHLDRTSNPWVAKLDHPVTGTPTTYWLPTPTGGRVAPSLALDAANGDWDAALLDHASLVFAGPTPSRLTGQAFDRAGTHPTLIVLRANWEKKAPSGPKVGFLLDATIGTWSRELLGGAVSNPELSWEYWNGAWSKLLLTLEGTLHLKNSGAIEFKVPHDIAATDWAGKTHFWIRARLIGGDYGTETVTVITETLPDKKTKQTVDRSTEGIKPPLVVSLRVLYALCHEVEPTYVITRDSGSTRDQSEANATPGARVEAFVPLSVALGRLLADGSPAASKGACCAPECDCPGQPQTRAAAALTPPAAVNQPLPGTPATGRSLFLGFDAPLSGDSVKVLLTIAREAKHDGFAPLIVQALVGQRFVPLVAQDDTRALGESGVLKLSFSDPPTKVTLFGDRPLCWIRLAPAAGALGTWTPSLRGAYLNAVWASATETLTRELLGSSEGEPNLRVTLARPPVLRNSLELRVREPLGDEERKALRDASGDIKVLSDDPTLPGDWVLWERVTDPGDEGPKRRVYALDEQSGEIRFGDGQHGAVPPVGRDSIVAFRYQRTEPPAADAVDVPANAVETRTQLNLVTPVAGAEAVFSADHAAGGAPAEPDDRVLRFGMTKLRHRGRAVTAQDLEDLALESSPDIVQARAIVRGRKTRLVVVMRGDDPAPRAAQKRELKRLLLAATPPSFDQDALAIVPPKLRRLHVALRLRVENLDYAGSVAEAVKTRLMGLLDTATGGISKEGWPLGASPRDDEIAFALIDVPRLLGLASVILSEVRDDASTPLPAVLAPHELARLADDGIRFEFDLEEAAA